MAGQNKDSCKCCAMMAPLASGRDPLYPQSILEGKAATFLIAPPTSAVVRPEKSVDTANLDIKTLEEHKKVVVTKRFLQPLIKFTPLKSKDENGVLTSIFGCSVGGLFKRLDFLYLYAHKAISTNGTQMTARVSGRQDHQTQLSAMPSRTPRGGPGVRVARACISRLSAVRALWTQTLAWLRELFPSLDLKDDPN
ncbi:hypothetical protein EDD11_009345 [Mortierella claussenii]|nr:hypothetical protein EDD11_009345 [Mortierella claussenii]